MRLLLFALVAPILFALLDVDNATANGPHVYQIGVSKVDITPDYPIRLSGFGFRRHESEGVSQRIYARGLAISTKNTKPLVIIAIDSLGVRNGMVEEVARRLDKSHGIPRENIALTFTHSHCTPKVNGAADNIFSQPIPPAHQQHIQRYTKELTDLIAQAARKAIENREAARLEWATGTVRFAKNRRTEGGPVDHDLPVLVVRNVDGDTIRALYVTYACHNVTLSFNRISGDWAGYAAKMIERRFPGSTALVSIGAGSDSNPQSGVTGDKVDIAEQQGVEIATEVSRLLRADLKPVIGRPAATLKRIDLPLNDLPSRAQLQALAAKGGPAGYNATTQLAKLDRGQSLLAKIDYPIQTWSFGDSLCIVFLAGEVCVDYSTRLKRELNRDRFWLNAYSNDFCSYIPSERLVREGGYGGGAEIPYFALPTTLKTGLEQLIVDEVHRQVPKSFHIPKGTQGVPPKSPKESLQSMRTHNDLRIELVAAEPLVTDPVAIDFGPDGRLWVAEMNDYGHGVYEQIQQHGRIRWLRDTNGDGRFDQAHTFLDGLRYPTDVKVWRDGVLICDAPDILFASDTDGDGTADSTKKLFSGFEIYNAQARVNSLRFGLDNWIYGSCGLFGGKITSSLTGRTIDISSRDFRLNPDTGEIEPATGRTQQGRCRNDWGDWFGCTNGTLITHYPLVERYTRRNPHRASPPSAAGVAANSEALRLYPPKGLVRFELSGPPGNATSACGLGIYRDTRLGPEYIGNAFTCEPVHQLVHRIVLMPNGLRHLGRRADNEQQSEFLTSTDKWFRPVQIRTGTDGALWVVDMYRYVIEHSRWIPQKTLQNLDVYAGQGRGRIYRIVPGTGHPNRPGANTEKTVPDVRLDKLSGDELVQQLDHSNGPIRDLVQQMLIWRKAKDTTPALLELAKSAKLPQGRIHALCTLDALGELNPDVLLTALRSKHPEVVRHGVRLSETLLNDSSELTEAVIRHAQHPSVRVRQQIAWSLGESKTPQAAIALARLAGAKETDNYFRAAVLSSINPLNAPAVLKAYRNLPANRQLADTLRELMTLAVRMGDASSIVGTLQSVTPGIQESKAGIRNAEWDPALFTSVLDAADARKQTSKITFNSSLRERVQAVHVAAARVVARRDESDARYRMALTILGRRRGPVTRRLLEKKENNALSAMVGLISAQQSAAIQQAAITAMSRTGEVAVAKLLLERYRSVSSSTRSAILDVLLSREDWTSTLLDEVESGRIRRTSFDAARRQRLLVHRNNGLRARAAKFFQSEGSPNQAAVLKSHEPALALSANVERGRTVFRKSCASCHRLENHGHVVGPNLTTLTNRDPKWLLTTMLDPNREVDARYISWTAVRDDGRTASGMIVEETTASVRLREAGGKEYTILRSEILEFRSSELSVMPVGLQRDMSHQNFADVIAYISSFESPAKQLPGNRPKLITPNDRGNLSLTAASAEIRGGDIVFEAPFGNIGSWHGESDRATWRVNLPKTGRFDIYLDVSCANDSAGNRFRIEGLPRPIRGIVNATGGWDRFHQVKVGTVELDSGRLVITVRPDGPLTKRSLFDLRELRLVPAGRQPMFAVSSPKDTPLPASAARIAEFLLDNSQSIERRQKVIDLRPGVGPAIVAQLVTDLKPDDEKEEYRRIPWIWRVALTVGKRNDGGEIRDLLNVSLPHREQPLRDWQAVVVGGGVINGLSQINQWPNQRIGEVLSGASAIAGRWSRTLQLAAEMADNTRVRSGTRYDALRMIALAGWDKSGQQLLRYLADGVSDELQMGAVSGLSDIRSGGSEIRPLIEAFSRLSKRNQKLAFEALNRTETRALALLKAIESQRIPKESVDQKLLLEHRSESVRTRAREILK
jgi:putative membrane-bound dehydrogenase-like protein